MLEIVLDGEQQDARANGQRQTAAGSRSVNSGREHAIPVTLDDRPECLHVARGPGSTPAAVSRPFLGSGNAVIVTSARLQRTRNQKESARSLALSEYSTPGSCGKARLVLQHRRPMPEPAETGVTK